MAKKRLALSVVFSVLLNYAAAQTIVVQVPASIGQDIETLIISDPVLDGLKDITSIQLRLQGSFTAGEGLYIGMVYDPIDGYIPGEVLGGIGMGLSAYSSALQESILFFFYDGLFDMNQEFDLRSANLVLDGSFSLYANFFPGSGGNFIATVKEPVLNITSAELIFTTIPEPITVALLGLGALLLRRKRQ